jgi:hypothetical protein
LRSIHEGVQKYLGPLDLPEPQGDEIAGIVGTIEQVENHIGRKLESPDH